MNHGGNVWQGEGPESWLDFSANLRPEGMPEWVKETLTRSVKDARYYPDQDMKSAREGLAAYAGVEPENILPSSGGAAAIELALKLEKGRVCVQPPTFGEYARIAQALGRLAVFSLDGCCSGDTAVICNPNNPTGETLDRETVLHTAEELQQKGAALVVDEAFTDYVPGISVRAFVRGGLRAVGSLTKILCIPGVRLGYICASAQEIALLERALLPWPASAFAAAVAAELPRHIDEIRQYAEENRIRRGRFAASLTSLGARVLPSQANFILCDFGRNMNGAVKELESKGILVRECASFGLGSRYLRLAVRTDRENDILIGEIRKCLEY